MNAIKMENSVQVQGLQQAHDVVRWMGQGILPSVANAHAAFQAVEAQRDADGDTDLTLARKVIAAIAAGISPSQQNCLTAARDIETVMDSLRDVESSGQSLRSRFDSMR